MEDVSSLMRGREVLEATLTDTILDEYDKVCGESGLETFESITLPRLFALYRPDSNILWREAKKTIEQAGDCKPSEIDNFLENCVEAVKYKSREDVALEFKRHYRGETISRTELRETDREMYNLLKRFGLMDEFIPKHTYRGKLW